MRLSVFRRVDGALLVMPARVPAVPTLTCARSDAPTCRSIISPMRWSRTWRAWAMHGKVGFAAARFKAALVTGG